MRIEIKKSGQNYDVRIVGQSHYDVWSPGRGPHAGEIKKDYPEIESLYNEMTAAGDSTIEIPDPPKKVMPRKLKKAIHPAKPKGTNNRL